MLKIVKDMLVVGVIFLGWSLVASADENPKIIQLEDIFAQVQGRVAEPSTGGFSPILWKLGAGAQFNSWLSLDTSVGASQLLYLPNWSTPPSDSVSLLDLKAQMMTDFGDFYAGQFQIPWGLEGTSDEAALWLPRSMFYEKGALPLRDIGGGFKTDYDGYFMNVAAHNGLGAGVTNNTNRLFVTGQTGYRGKAHSVVGLSLTAGHIISPLTSMDTKVRGANAFYGFNIFGLGLQLESSVIESKTDAQTTDVLAWHADLQHPLSDHINLIYRYEAYNPNLRVSSNVLSRGYIGGEIHSADNFSRLFLFLVKNNESQSETPNDEIQLAWRVSPMKEF